MNRRFITSRRSDASEDAIVAWSCRKRKRRARYGKNSILFVGRNRAIRRHNLRRFAWLDGVRRGVPTACSGAPGSVKMSMILEEIGCGCEATGGFLKRPREKAVSGSNARSPGRLFGEN